MASSFYRLQNTEVIAEEREVYRYLGYTAAAQADATVQVLVREAIQQLRPLLRPQVVYDTFELQEEQDDTLSLANITIKSADLSRNLSGCTAVTVFAATIGAQVDALIRRTQRLDSVQAAVLQAAGAMFIESVCDSFNAMISEQAAHNGLTTRPRYSPGYGDVPLSVQQLIFTILPCTKIGLSLMDTLIMAPEKSVTAFIGIAPK